MKTTKQKETTITINHEKVAKEKNSSHYWVIEEGLSSIMLGVKPGPRMLDFLQHIEVITIK